ncbi:MAG TPA: TrkH family potassium uptake protein [Dysgonamonadaceae bacterium]|nr:TrkH family potassium uptake protein [Dysgonamonadaceae bacterium]
MRKEAIIKYIGYVLLFNALFLYISALISFFLNEASLVPLLYSGLVCTILGLFPLIFTEKIDELRFNEGLAISVFGWFITCVVGMLPYVMWGGEFTFANAFFESVSGYTTTGATILTEIETLPKGILFWRSSTHWIGGMGVILFVLLILPQARGMRSSLYKTEVSNLSRMNFKTKAQQIGRIIAIVYVSLTLLETIILWSLGMTFFDAICHSMSTIATGGFSTKNTSMAFYNNFWMELTIVVFMVLSSLHFGMLYITIIGKKPNLLHSKSARSYFLLIIVGVLAVAYKLYDENLYNAVDALRHSLFQVTSLVSTTGFATVDTSVWPVFTVIILIYFTIQGSMVGSTAGGFKFDRIYLFFQILKKQLRLIKHPQGVFAAKIDGEIVGKEIELQTLTFLVIYILTFFIVTVLLTFMDIDGLTAFSASIASIANVGPGFGEVGSLNNFSALPTAAKYLLSFEMLLGRLEIMNILALFLLFKRNN